MDLALKEKHYHGGSMFTASAFVSKSRWISSFFPPTKFITNTFIHRLQVIIEVHN